MRNLVSIFMFFYYEIYCYYYYTVYANPMSTGGNKHKKTKTVIWVFSNFLLVLVLFFLNDYKDFDLRKRTLTYRIIHSDQIMNLKLLTPLVLNFLFAS